jgi:hypothetical protein
VGADEAFNPTDVGELYPDAVVFKADVSGADQRQKEFRVIAIRWESWYAPFLKMRALILEPFMATERRTKG